jgi:hypothetical protein
MATVFQASASSAEDSERTFFLAMAVAFAVTVIAAFGLWVLTGRSTFLSPWFVHVHAISFMGWIAIYLAQNILIFRGDTVRHRRLGRIGAGWAAWMVALGLALTPYSLSLGRQAPIFTHPFFLALDWGTIVIFAGLVLAAIANIRRTEWHRRLMLCATANVIAPAWGRLLAFFDAEGAWTNAAALLCYVLAAMIADLIIRGRVHRAYYWGGAAIAAWPVSIELLIRFPPFVTLAETIAASH